MLMKIKVILKATGKDIEMTLNSRNITSVSYLAKCFWRPCSNITASEVSSFGRMSKPTMSLICKSRGT